MSGHNSNFHDAKCVAYRINPDLHGQSDLDDAEITIVISRTGPAKATVRYLSAGLPPMQEQPGSFAAALRAREAAFND